MVITVEKRKQENLDPFENSTFNPYTKPIATVNPGEIVSIHTWDAFGGVVKPQVKLSQFIRGMLLGELLSPDKLSNRLLIREKLGL